MTEQPTTPQTGATPTSPFRATAAEANAMLGSKLMLAGGVTSLLTLVAAACSLGVSLFWGFSAFVCVLTLLFASVVAIHRGDWGWLLALVVPIGFFALDVIYWVAAGAFTNPLGGDFVAFFVFLPGLALICIEAILLIIYSVQVRRPRTD